MARALQKVQKAIAKKRGGKTTALHENSRNAQRLRQAGAREDKLARILSAAAKSNRIYVDRAAWFQEQVKDTEEPLSEAELQQLVADFIRREDEELAQLKSAQRPGRPRSKAEENIQTRIDIEMGQFKAGFWAPDLRDTESLEKLKRWGGQWGGMNTLNFVRVMKDGEVKPSTFPPKSLS